MIYSRRNGLSRTIKRCRDFQWSRMETNGNCKASRWDVCGIFQSSGCKQSDEQAPRAGTAATANKMHWSSAPKLDWVYWAGDCEGSTVCRQQPSLSVWRGPRCDCCRLRRLPNKTGSNQVPAAQLSLNSLPSTVLARRMFSRVIQTEARLTPVGGGRYGWGKPELVMECVCHLPRGFVEDEWGYQEWSARTKKADAVLGKIVEGELGIWNGKRRKLRKSSQFRASCRRWSADGHSWRDPLGHPPVLYYFQAPERIRCDSISICTSVAQALSQSGLHLSCLLVFIGQMEVAGPQSLARAFARPATRPCSLLRNEPL